jgi:hypothetical protein
MMKEAWNIVQCLILSILLSLVLSPFSLAQAQRGEAPKPPQDMQQMMEMLKNRG